MNIPQKCGIQKKRKEWIDFSRAIAMFLVMYGHFNPKMEWLFVFTNPIKIPLFFIISGYLLDTKKYSFHKFLKTRIIGLLVPYFCLSIIRSIPTIIISVIQSNDLMAVIKDLVYSIAIGEGLWFIPCLFVTEVLVYVEQNIIWEKIKIPFIKNKKCAMQIVFISLSMLMMTVINNRESLAWHIDTAVVMTGCIIIGQIYKENEDMFSQPRTVVFFIITFIGLMMVHVFLNGSASIDPNHNVYCTAVITFLSIWFGSYAVLGISKGITRFPKSILFVGRNTLPYYALHTTIKPFVEKAFLYVFHDNMIVNSIVIRQIVFLLVCLVCAVFVVFLNRYFPFCVGKKKCME